MSQSLELAVVVSTPESLWANPNRTVAAFGAVPFSFSTNRGPLTYDAPRIFALWSRRGTKSGDSFPATARCHPAIIRVTEPAKVLLSPYSMPYRRADRSHLGKIGSVEKIVGHSNLGDSFRWVVRCARDFPPNINWGQKLTRRTRMGVSSAPLLCSLHSTISQPPPSHTTTITHQSERKKERVFSVSWYSTLV